MNHIKTFSIASFAMAAALGAAQLGTQMPLRVVINGGLMQFPDQQPIQRNGRVLVPMRGVFERLGAEVDWDSDTQTVTAFKQGVRVVLTIGRHQATINQRQVQLDARVRVLGGSTMVPLRFISEALGADVNWNQSMLEVDITQAGDNAILDTTSDQTGITSTNGGSPINQSPPLQAGMAVIAVNTVVPWELKHRIRSYDAKINDIFTATIVTGANTDYLGIPAGTILYGRVGYVHRAEPGVPGVVELRFERIMTPGGQRMEVAGQLISLEGESVATDAKGRITATHQHPANRIMYAGYGQGGEGIMVGLRSRTQIHNSAILGMLNQTITPEQRQSETKNVDIATGSHFGLRLSMTIVLPNNVK